MAKIGCRVLSKKNLNVLLQAFGEELSTLSKFTPQVALLALDLVIG